MLTGRQLRAARSLIGWSQDQLADRAIVAVGTIRRLEAIDGEANCTTSIMRKISETLQAAGVQWDSNGGPGVRFVA